MCYFLLLRRVVFSVFLSVIGLYLLCFHPDSGFSIYDLWLLVGAIFYGVHILVVDKYSRVHPIKASCVQFLVVGILSLLPMLIIESPSLTSLIECRVPLLYAGLLACGVAYTLQMFGQKHTFPILASLILCLESVFAVIGYSIYLTIISFKPKVLGTP